MTSPNNQPSTAKNLAQVERQAASIIDLTTYGKLLVGAWLLFLVGLMLPHSGSVRGFHVVIFQAERLGLKIGIAEIVFVILGTLAVVIFGGLLLLTKRTVFANISFLLSGMASFASLLGIWMRLQDRENTGGPGVGIGLLLEVLAVMITVYALSFMVMRRSDEQERIAKQRAQQDNLDEVGKVQRDAFISQRHNTPETNPLLIDDRRKRAAERHRKTQD